MPPDVQRSSETTYVPLWLFDLKGLSPSAKWLYVTLLGYAGTSDHCDPGYDQLMCDMQCSRNTLSRYIRALKKRGLLEAMNQGHEWNCIYFIKTPEEVR
jgi:hypothetical protein